MQNNIIRMPEPRNLSEKFLFKSSDFKIQYVRKVSAGSALSINDMSDDYLADNRKKLDDLLIRDKDYVALYVVYGDSMAPKLENGDWIIIDTDVREYYNCPEKLNGKVVVAVVDGDENVKRLKLNGGKIFLCPDNPSHDIIEVPEHSRLDLVGIVTKVIKDV